MKKFLIKAAVFFGVMALTVMIIEVALLTRPNLYSWKQDYMDSHLNEIKVLLLGQSHIEEGINPLYIRTDSIYNFAISGQNLLWTEQLAQRYIPRMENLRVVLLPFSYGMGYHSQPNPKTKKGPNISSTYRCMYVKYMHLHENRLTDWLYWSELVNSRMNAIGRFQSEEDKSLLQLDTLRGYVPLPLKGRSEEWQIGHLPGVLDYCQRDEAFFERMNSILSLCQQRNIRVILVAIPWWKSAHAEMTPQGVRKMQEVASELMAKYPCVEYRNYVFDSRFGANDFNDATHLNELGAPKFATILKHDFNL